MKRLVNRSLIFPALGARQNLAHLQCAMPGANRSQRLHLWLPSDRAFGAWIGDPDLETMSLQTFFVNFGLLADAPNGLAKLRELILQLAVEGKLVRQNPNDESASVLLGRIKTEQDKIRKKKKEPTLPLANGDRKPPFELPSGWIWARLSDVGHEWGQKKPDVNFTYIDVAAIDNERGIITDEVKLLDPSEAPSRARKIVKRGTVIYSTVRPYLLNIAIVENDYSPEPIASTAFAVIHPFDGVSAKYLFSYLRSRTFIDFVEEQMQGVAYPAINAEKLFTAFVPLPPSAEQKRIVAKIDELMRLSDELDARRQARSESRVRLNNVTLAPLNNAASLAPEEFEQVSARLADNFAALYDSAETVARLRSTILRLAVQGKLAKQVPRDEPASLLLERSRRKKRQLISEGAIKSRKPSAISTDEPLCIPSGWSWARFGDLGSFLGGGTPSKANPSFWQGSIPWVSPKDMKTLYIADTQDHLSSEAVEQSVVQVIPRRSLLMVVRGMILAHSFPVALTLEEVTINQDMKALQIMLPEVSEYLLLACRGLKEVMLSKVARSSHGTCRLESTEVEAFLIPMPPLEEQNRIVAKVNQLMALCDELESKLRQVEADSEKLMDAAVRHVLASVSAMTTRIPAGASA